MPHAEEFTPIVDMDAWTQFWADNREALEDEIGDEAECLALALNLSLLVGGGAAPLFRVGFTL